MTTVSESDADRASFSAQSPTDRVSGFEVKSAVASGRLIDLEPSATSGDLPDLALSGHASGTIDARNPAVEKTPRFNLPSTLHEESDADRPLQPSESGSG